MKIAFRIGELFESNWVHGGPRAICEEAVFFSDKRPKRGRGNHINDLETM